jgi:lysophospholipase L1-like esterase
MVFVIALFLTISVLRNRRDWLYRVRYSAILLFCSFGFAALFAEFIVRGMDPLGISYYEEAKRYHLYKLADPDLFFRHRPNIDETYQGVRVTTNSLGLRDQAVESRREQEYRILFLGDSVTFGWGVSADDTFVSQSEILFRERTNRDVHTINSGVGGYNTRSELEFLRRHGAELQPDLVLLMYIGNDIEGTTGFPFDPWSANSFADKSPPEKIRLLLGKSWLYRLLHHVSTFWAGDPTAQAIDTTSAGWRESVTALTSMDRYCKDRQIPLVVLFYRMQAQEPGNSISVKLRELAVQEGFLFADLVDIFDGQEPRQLINSIIDSHPNPRGHAIIANAVVEFLLQNRLPPPEAYSGQASALPARAVTGQ